MPNWKKIILNGGTGELTTLKLTSLTEDNTGTKVLTLDTNNNIKLTGSFGGGGGTVTSIASGDGLSGGTITNSGTLAVDSTVVRTTGAQTIGGNKTFSSSVTVGSINGQDRLNIEKYSATYPHAYIQAGVTDQNTKVGIKIDTRDNNGTAGSHLTLDGDTKLSTFAGNISSAGIVLDGNTINGIDDSGEFTDDDSHIMTSAAVQDKILGYGYGTGDVNTTGTPADNQIATFTNSTTVEGSSNLTYGGLAVGLVVNGDITNSTNSGAIVTTFMKVGNGTASSPAIRFTNDTDIGIYKHASSAIMEFSVSGASRLSLSTNGIQTPSLGVGTSPTSTTGLIRATNDVVAYYSSDKRLKNNIETIKSPLEKLNKINGVEFDWIPKEGIHENEGHDVGVIAQEVEKVIPEIVQTRDNGYKAVKYEKIVPLLIESIKELKAEIEELKKSK
jgi:hypothetical protein